MPTLRGAGALVLGFLVFSCSLEEFGDATPASTNDASTGGFFTGGAAGSGGFPEASLGGTGGITGGTGGIAGDSGLGGNPDGGGGTDSGTGGVDGGTGGAPTWKPSDINNCMVWLDAADMATMTLSGQNVTAWTSKCGSTSVTATMPKAPSTVLVGSKRAVRCDGVDDELVFGGTPPQASDYSLFFVVSKNFGGQQKAIWSNRSLTFVPGVTPTFLGFYSQRMFIFQNTAAPTTMPGAKNDVGTETRFYELVVSAGKRELVLDGTVESSDTATGTSTLLSGTLCADNSANFAAFDLREVVFYDRALMLPERQKIRTELIAKWAP